MRRIDDGKIGEYAAAAELLKRGICPTWPSVESLPYDIIAEVNGRFARLQIKASNQDRPTLRIAMGSRARTYTKSDVDYIVFWIRKKDKWLVIPVEEITKPNIYINLDSRKCRWRVYEDAWDLIGGRS
jgi:hypothetical protein